MLIGYSDTTNLLSGITHKTGLITFNGPAIITFAKPSVPDETIECFRNLVMNGETNYTYTISKKFSDNQWWVEDKMEFSPNSGLETYKKGKILFIEDDEAENPKTLDRYFTQLRHMGVYDQINGMVVGRFPRCVGLNDQDSLKMILDNALKGYIFPVITEFDMGHTDPIMTIPLGAKVSIDGNKKTISLLEAVTK